ncbi:PKD domain-containing protein, partial [Hanstruepera flava]|uniref:PKD domain-containing protein n=1 Tax=Hanstruepera flava TaxID=2930218 RepID=UPI0020280FF0
MKTNTYLINFRKYFFLIFIFSLTSTFSQDLRDCGYNCTTNAFSIESVFLSATDVPGTPLTNTSCESGVPQQVYMIAEISSNRNSAVYHGRIFADLMVGDSSIMISEYLGTLPSSNSGLTQRLVYGPFNWVCGELLTLENVLVVWKTSRNNGPDENDPYDCGSYSSSQCQFPSDLIVSTPLAVQYDYTACTDNNGIATVTFESTTIGGTPPYTYSWNYDGGNFIGGTASSPIVEYDINGGPYNPTLTVTDSNGNVNLYPYSVTLSFPSILINSTSFTSAQCASNDGTATFTATGGTAPYTFTVNSNTTGGSTFVNGPPSTELVVINAGAGSISVTITDAAGCEAEETLVMATGDSEDPQITAPQDYTIEGCDTSAITSLPYSETPVTITLTELQNALDGGGNASDDVSINEITYQDISSGTCVITVTRTFTITDGCDKTASDTQTIIIQDTTAPVAPSAPADITYECIADVPAPGDLTANDNCAGDITVTGVDNTDSSDP